MPKLIDLVGQKFNRLSVISRTENRGNRPMWLCVCDCGNVTSASGYDLKSSNTKSCGCLRLENSTTHGGCKTQAYKSWRAMRYRCANKNSRFFHHYGGRGITICPEWEDFSAFMRDMGERPHKHTLERINNNGNYTPDNCIWATQKTQTNNQRKNVRITFMGKTLTLAQWAESLHINYNTLYGRLASGWTVEKSLLQPVKKI